MILSKYFILLLFVFFFFVSTFSFLVQSDNKGKRQNTNNQSNSPHNFYNPSPTPTNSNNLNYFNDSDTVFNESTFQPTAQSTYYQPPTPQVPHKIQPQQGTFYDPGQQQMKTNKPSNGNRDR